MKLGKKDEKKTMNEVEVVCGLGCSSKELQRMKEVAMKKFLKAVRK